MNQIKPVFNKSNKQRVPVLMCQMSKMPGFQSGPGDSVDVD